MHNWNTRERKKQIFIVMAKNFPRLMTDTKLQIQEAQRIPRKTNTIYIHINTHTHTHIQIRLSISYSRYRKSKTKFEGS